MEPYVLRTDAIARMQELKDCFDLENKRTAAGAVLDCMGIVEDLEGKTISFEPEKAERTVCLEPFFPDGQIGRDVYRCGKCQNRVGRHSRYCETCGRRLVDSHG